MSTKALKLSLTALAIGLMSSGTSAADAGNSQGKDQEAIYGSQLMTREERIGHRNKMRSLRTQEEREAYRQEHHRLMQERAKERGVAMPDAPPPRGMGMGPGAPGMGQGMGPGGSQR